MVTLLAGCHPATPPITVDTLDLVTPDGPVHGFVARVNLADPRVRMVVTGALTEARRVGLPANADAVLEPTDVWAAKERVTLAVNANFFTWLGVKKVGEPAEVIGLSMSDGAVVSPAREYHGERDPVLVIDSDRRARIGRVDPGPRAVEGVAGIGGEEKDAIPGTALVTDGVNTGATARVEPGKRHPRTGAGVTRDGRTLILCVVDGRQKGYSVGLTLPELADVMIGQNAYEAVNLDGGGSSSFVYVPRDGKRMMNRPSDGQFRPVANHLGVRLAAPAPDFMSD